MVALGPVDMRLPNVAVDLCFHEPATRISPPVPKLFCHTGIVTHVVLDCSISGVHIPVPRK